MNNFEEAIEVIGQGVFNLFIDRDENGKCNKPDEAESVNCVYRLLDAAAEGYVLIKWPKSQEFMEKEWFKKEAILALGSEDKTGGSAYFIPIKRIV